ncbi:MAG TPA: glycosyltransferase family 1 protein [Polyangiaceae bacterium]|nr:glycosyltransferase family 1 protein [Polyangiaceae bacterium]
MNAPRSVLIDATPALDASGYRGIGRLIRELLYGLSETREQWAGRLAVSALITLDSARGAQISQDLRGAADWLAERGGSVSHEALVELRGRFLERAARPSSVLHIAEVLGTPALVHPRAVVTCHDMIPLRMPRAYLGGGKKRWLRRWLEEYVRHRFAKRIVAISKRTRDDVAELLKLPLDRIDVVSNGIDLRRWSPRPSALDLDRLRGWDLTGTDYVLFVGYGDPRKGIEAMMRAVAMAQRSRPLTLVWAGQLSQGERQRHFMQAYACGVEPYVRFMGYVSDEELAILYRGARAHLFLSKLEGFGLSVAEAMACGCPVIVVRGSGADEVAGSAGFLVERDDFTAAAHAIDSVLTSPTETARHIALGLERAALFGRQRMAAGYVQSWLRACERPSEEGSLARR